MSDFFILVLRSSSDKTTSVSGVGSCERHSVEWRADALITTCRHVLRVPKVRPSLPGRRRSAHEKFPFIAVGMCPLAGFAQRFVTGVRVTVAPPALSITTARPARARRARVSLAAFFLGLRLVSKGRIGPRDDRAPRPIKKHSPCNPSPMT
jgi:hypothetical protein